MLLFFSNHYTAIKHEKGWPFCKYVSIYLYVGIVSSCITMYIEGEEYLNMYASLMSMYHSVSCLESDKKFSDLIIFLTNFDDFSNRMKQVALVVLD